MLWLAAAHSLSSSKMNMDSRQPCNNCLMCTTVTIRFRIQNQGYGGSDCFQCHYINSYPVCCAKSPEHAGHDAISCPNCRLYTPYCNPTGQSADHTCQDAICCACHEHACANCRSKLPRCNFLCRLLACMCILSRCLASETWVHPHMTSLVGLADTCINLSVSNWATS